MRTVFIVLLTVLGHAQFVDAASLPCQVDIQSELKRPILESAEYMGYATAYRRLAAADQAVDDTWCAAGTNAVALAKLCRETRARAVASFGGFPERTPLHARITCVLKRDGYHIEKLLCESRPGFFVTGHVYVPESADFKPPYAAVLVPCGHSEDGKLGRVYQHAGVLLARAGFVGLVFDPVDQGERKQRPARRNCGVGHNAMGALAMLLGESGLRVRLWDAMRMLDYLSERPDVDAARLGVMGNSGGGTMSAMLAAFDDRIKAAAPSSYISNLRRVVDGCGPQDSEQILYGQLGYNLNHLGLLLLRHPTPTLVNASHDDFFPIDGTLETWRALARATQPSGTFSRYELTEAAGKHGWKAGMLATSIAWMRRWLRDEEVMLPTADERFRMDVANPASRLGLETMLSATEGRVTETGAVMDLAGSRSVYQVMRDDLDLYMAKRPKMTTSDRAAAAVAAARIRSRAEADIRPIVVSEGRTNGVAVVRLGFSEPTGFTMPGVLLVPAVVSGTPCLYAGDRGRAAFADEVSSALAKGRPVLVVDLEGLGEIGVTKRRIHVGSCVDDGLGKIHYLLGDSLVGRRAEQLRAAADVLKDRFNAVPEIVVDGAVAIPAAHARAADAKLFAQLTIRNPPLSWSEAIRRAVTEPIQWTYTDAVQGALRTYDWTDLLAVDGLK